MSRSQRLVCGVDSFFSLSAKPASFASFSTECSGTCALRAPRPASTSTNALRYSRMVPSVRLSTSPRSTSCDDMNTFHTGCSSSKISLL